MIGYQLNSSCFNLNSIIFLGSTVAVVYVSFWYWRCIARLVFVGTRISILNNLPDYIPTFFDGAVSSPSLSLFWSSTSTGSSTLPSSSPNLLQHDKKRVLVLTILNLQILFSPSKILTTFSLKEHYPNFFDDLETKGTNEDTGIDSNCIEIIWSEIFSVVIFILHTWGVPQ